MNALTAVSPGEPRAPGPVKAVPVISAGTVRIRPAILCGSRKPLYWRLPASRQQTPPQPINAYVVERAKTLILSGTWQDRDSATDDTHSLAASPVI